MDNIMIIGDLSTGIRNAYLDAWIINDELRWELRIFGDEIKMPILNWDPMLILSDAPELTMSKFDPTSERFAISLNGGDFYFAIAGDCIPVENFQFRMERESIEDKPYAFRIRAEGVVDTCYTGYTPETTLVIRCEAAFRGVYVHLESDRSLISKFFKNGIWQEIESDSLTYRKYQFKIKGEESTRAPTNSVERANLPE